MSVYQTSCCLLSGRVSSALLSLLSLQEPLRLWQLCCSAWRLISVSIVSILDVRHWCLLQETSKYAVSALVNLSENNKAMVTMLNKRMVGRLMDGIKVTASLLLDPPAAGVIPCAV